MTDSTPSPKTSDKTVAQLQEEFHTLNEQAMELQAKLAAIAKQLSDHGFVASKPDRLDPSGKDTVRF